MEAMAKHRAPTATAIGDEVTIRINCRQTALGSSGNDRSRSACRLLTGVTDSLRRPAGIDEASAGRNAERRQPQYHDRARDQAPKTGDGKADGERKSALDLFC
jgi:hypothetical protein